MTKEVLAMKDEQFTQILRAINDVRSDLSDFKNEMNRRWDANDKRWEENENRWKECDKKFLSIDKELDKINKKIEQRYKDTIKVFDAYEESTENMYQENKQKIIALQKHLKIANV